MVVPLKLIMGNFCNLEIRKENSKEKSLFQDLKLSILKRVLYQKNWLKREAFCRIFSYRRMMGIDGSLSAYTEFILKEFGLVAIQPQPRTANKERTSVYRYFLRFKQENVVQDETACFRTYLTFLKPTGHVMHQQFNIQQLYVLPTLYLCVLYLSENKQRLMSLTA